MVPEAILPEASPSPRQVVGGMWGWLMRMRWRRAARRMTEADIDELRKRIVIITRQLDQLPISSKLAKRRMELLTDRERCETIISAWEDWHGTGGAG